MEQMLGYRPERVVEATLGAPSSAEHAKAYEKSQTPAPVVSAHGALIVTAPGRRRRWGRAAPATGRAVPAG
ncbi:hypothetical protein GCM10020216_107230 [Nonomuraea helvata]